MRRACVRVMAVLLCFVCTGSMKADPSPSVRYLMNDNLTMLEWGMFRLETSVKAFSWNSSPEIAHHFANVEYDWAKNQLNINIVVYPKYRTLQSTTPKQVCASLVDQSKSLFGVKPGWEPVRELNGIATYFRHKAFRDPKEPKTFSADLEAMTLLHVDVMVSPTDKPIFKNAVSCESELLNSEVRFFTTSDGQ